MNITFFIGNGFDIAQKLKTRYSDFYKYYLAEGINPHDCISENIKADDPNWSDLEIQLGLLFDKSNELDDFLDAKELLETELVHYLEKEEKRLVITNKESLIIEFKNKINKIYSDFNVNESEYYKNTLNSRQENMNYQFISFNYTHVLDKLFDFTGKIKSEIGAHSIGSLRYTHNIHNPIHIHGELGKENIILGVDNINQLGTDIEEDENTECMIKSEINTRIGENKEQKVIDVIDNSNFIFIYGMSLGKTDVRWWKRICEWLKYSKSRRLYIYVHEEKRLNDSATPKIRYENKVRNKFLDAAECMDKKTRDQIKSQILAIQNSQIFKFENMGVPKR